MCTIAKHFFNIHASSPLTSLKACINAPAVESNQTEIGKDHPIFECLKNISDDQIKDCTKKLGKTNLRNYENMRSWLANYFFVYDKNDPLESLKKFITGELPELDVTLKKEQNKRKSESRSGLSAKNKDWVINSLTIQY